MVVSGAAPVTTWFARADETFSEGAQDACEQQAMLELSKPGVRVAITDIDKVTVRGRIAEIMGLDEVVLRPPPAQEAEVLIGGKAYFTSGIGHGSGSYFLGHSHVAGDPFWYLSRGGLVRSKSDPRPQVDIIAYASGNEAGELEDPEPWQPDSEFQWWSRPHGHWEKFRPNEFYMLPSRECREPQSIQD